MFVLLKPWGTHAPAAVRTPLNMPMSKYNVYFGAFSLVVAFYYT